MSAPAQHQYGQTLDDVKKIVRPVSTKESWGGLMICTNRPEFCMARIDLTAGIAQPLHFLPTSWVSYFVEQGRVLVRTVAQNGEPQALMLEKGKTIRLKEGTPHAFLGLDSAVVYAFGQQNMFDGSYAVETASEAAAKFKPLQATPPAARGDKTDDFREKYWGSIESIVSREVAGKRIGILAGKQSSMEFHVFKSEAYYMHSGEVRVGLRIGRGENKSVVLREGDLFEVLPGTMHMRIGITDTVIMEVSTKDDDGDSHLVEDGMKYKHIET